MLNSGYHHPTSFPNFNHIQVNIAKVLFPSAVRPCLHTFTVILLFPFSLEWFLFYPLCAISLPAFSPSLSVSRTLSLFSTAPFLTCCLPSFWLICTVKTLSLEIRLTVQSAAGTVASSSQSPVMMMMMMMSDRSHWQESRPAPSSITQSN